MDQTLAAENIIIIFENVLKTLLKKQNIITAFHRICQLKMGNIGAVHQT